MVGVCTVVSCGNAGPRGRDIEEKIKRGLSFFSLPTNPQLREIWIRKCGRKDIAYIKPASIRICSEHFLPEDFDPSYLLRKRLMPYAKAALCKGAIPSQKLPGQPR